MRNRRFTGLTRRWFAASVCALGMCSGVRGGVDRALDFVVIKPGAPGSSQEAEPVMAALAEYVEKKIGGATRIRGVYFNELEPALAHLDAQPIQWGIVTLGFYAEHGAERTATALASTRPGGREKDAWHLVVRRDGPDAWTDLEGKVFGSMLFETRNAALWVFNRPPDQLRFTLKGTRKPLRTLRKVAVGTVAGMLLEQAELETLEALPLFGQLKVIHSSQPLPTSPVVWFGPINDRARKLASALLAMGTDPEAQRVLDLLRTRGFGKPDDALTAFQGDGSPPTQPGTGSGQAGGPH